MSSPHHTGALLDFLFWSLDKLSRPTIHNVTESFEAWEFRHKIRPQLRSLAQSGLIEFRKQTGQRVVVVTERGRLAATGGIDPAARWERGWDRQWRLLVFDLPGKQWNLRRRLWRWLRSQRFGYLQQSVWLSPDPVDDSSLPLKALKLTPDSYTVIEGHPVGTHTDADLVHGAWDFTIINRAYLKLIDLSDRGVKITSDRDSAPARRRRWLRVYRHVWIEAVNIDPLLPRALCPANYLGEQAWRRRRELLSRLAAPEQ